MLFGRTYEANLEKYMFTDSYYNEYEHIVRPDSPQYGTKQLEDSAYLEFHEVTK